MAIWYIYLWQIGIFVIWYIFPDFDMLSQEKSGNPAAHPPEEKTIRIEMQAGCSEVG
jgi:hypothetical protein